MPSRLAAEPRWRCSSRSIPSRTSSRISPRPSVLDQWGVGRQGYDDGLVILVSFEDDLAHGVISTYAGSGFKVAYLSVDEQDRLINEVMAPFRAGAVGTGLLAALAVIDAEVTTDATSALDTYRQVNAVVGIPGALALGLTAGSALIQWRRHGDDPDLVDSASVLMAGPPAGMTPPLATVLREGRATGNALRTASSSWRAPATSGSGISIAQRR